MPKRAAIIITDALNVVCTTRDGGYSIGYWEVETSERLLADLDDITSHIADHNDPEYWPEVRASAARVRALLPKEAQDGG